MTSNLKTEVTSLQNENGGGLATEATGKFESCRHALAKEDDSLLTAGEAAKILKKRGFAVKAAELVTWHIARYRREPEWHHAGMLPTSYGGGMKKTYFFDRDTIEGFDSTDAALIDELRAGIPVFRVEFKEYYGQYGRKRFQPIARFLIADRLRKNDTQIDRETFERLQPFDGKELEPYEDLSDFEARMVSA